MICNNCGNMIQDYSNKCPYCGAINSASYNVPKKRAKIDNIFSALVHDKTPGAILEFSFWCGVCAMALLSLIACILVESETEGYGVAFRILWFFMMLFQLGLGVMMAFRIKPIMMLVSSAVFYVIMPIWFFATTAGGSGASGVVIMLFILMLLAGTGLTVISIIHFFSRVNLKNIMVIMAIVSASILIILIICTYAIDTGSVWSEILDRYLTGSMKHRLIHYDNNIGAYWLGSMSYWITGVLITLFYVFFFWGCIDSRKDKIYTVNNAVPQGASPGYGNNPGIQCINGIGRGQIYYLNGREIYIGSGQGVHVYINAPYVSSVHCGIRFNPSSGLYEIRDNSANGVFLPSGTMLARGVYNAVSRGTVICIGSREQQFRLL